MPEDVEVVFCPSGTDAELLALALAAGGHGRPVVNIIVGPTEVGSGTPQAAAGLHYDNLVPRGGRVTAGTPVNAELAERVSVQTVNIRDERGEMLNEFYLDALVTEMVSRGCQRGAHVLLHLVAHSKTGMHAPSLECVDRITRRLSPDVTVVIDAAQGRVSRRGLNDVLRQGHLVMFTGSKFYGGPAFSGALFVPPHWQPEPRGITKLPDEFDQYFTAAAMPESWPQIRSHLTDWPNYGALLRWEAALAEIDAYYQVPSQSRLRILRAFEEAVPQVFAGSQSIRLMPVFPPIQDDSQTRLLESKTTVFSFQIVIENQPLALKELKTFHRELNSDVQNGLSGTPGERDVQTISHRPAGAVRGWLGRLADCLGRGNDRPRGHGFVAGRIARSQAGLAADTTEPTPPKGGIFGGRAHARRDTAPRKHAHRNRINRMEP